MQRRWLPPVSLARLWRGAIVLAATMVAGGLVMTTGETGAEPAAGDQLWQRATRLFKPLPPAVPNAENPVTAAKIELGKMLYFDTKLSQAGNVSCNSCHSLAEFGVDNLPTSQGDGGEHGNRNSPTVLNAALHAAQFWDGRAEDVEAQAGMPVLNPIEMAIPSREFLVERLSEYPDYERRFAQAFPGEAGGLTYRNIQLALAAFERTLLTPAPFDLYLLGDLKALPAPAREGMKTFMGYGCASCHNGVTLGGHIFRKFGLNEDYWVHTRSPKVDEGRFLITGEAGDRYVFKVASLRNVAKTWPYFHDGSVETLDQAIRVMVEVQIGVEMADEDVANLVAFLESLTGELPEVARSLPAGVTGR